jgi:formate hydrogenlyase subunit 3/multisubunit Na+/H+ antiporter MnhD subunit
LLVSVRISERTGRDWPEARVTGPLFRLACASGLIAATSSGDLLVSWIALDIATAAMILEVATAGRWSQRELAVRRMVSTWLPTSLLLLLAVILLAGMGGATRYVELEVTLPEYAASPAVIAGVALAAGSILVRVLRLVTLFGSVRRT